MANRKPAPKPTPPEDVPPVGCVFMFRTDPDTGELARIDVDSGSGSVEAMQVQGWALQPPADAEVN
jgi:hypothetical protein